MPIKWSAVKVIEAMDMADEFVNQATEPLEQARLVLREARKLANLPQYMDARLGRILGEVERAIGGSRLDPVGQVRAGIKAVRDAIPKQHLKEQGELAKLGSQQSLM